MMVNSKNFLKAIGRLLLMSVACTGHAESQGNTPNLAGMWLPIQERATVWQIDTLPLTENARQKLNDFDREKQDSTLFCMPYGTPRNILTTAPYPMEILQTDHQITIIFDRRGDVRRIFLNPAVKEEEPAVRWMGYSMGAWHGKELKVSTVAMTAESLLSEAGLPHSEALNVEETFSLDRKGDLLRVDFTLSDPTYYSKPLTASRYFRKVPEMEMIEGQGLCLLDKWRDQLENINRNQLRQQQ